MGTVIAAGAPLSESVPIAGRDLLAAAATLLRERSRGDATETRAVHSVRKIIKKARALLRLVRKALDPDVFAAEDERLRALARRLGPAREAQAFDQTMADLARRAPPELLPTLLRASEAVRGRRGGADHLSEPTWNELAVDVDAAETSLRRLSLHAHAARRLRAGVSRVARGAEDRLAEVEDWPVAAGFHAVRRRLKTLLCQMDLLEDLRSDPNGKLRARLDRLASILGDEHDLSVLMTTLDGASESITTADLEMLTSWLEQRRTRLRAKALKRARRLLRKRSRLIRGILGDAGSRADG